MPDLDAVEARLRAVLDPYGDLLEPATIYGMPVLRRPGAKAHDWFAGVQRTDAAVKFNFLPMHGNPTLLEGASPGLLRRRTGASVLKFTEVDETLVTELEGVVARAFVQYAGGDR